MTINDMNGSALLLDAVEASVDIDIAPCEQPAQCSALPFGPECRLGPERRMQVYLFGGLRVYIDGVRVPDELWGTKKSKLLFAHLVVRFGREIGREVLIDTLWPEFGGKRGVENFYVTWSVVKRAISDAGGECPYVNYGNALYSINTDLVRSDVEEFEELSRKVLFGECAAEEAHRAYARIDELYAGELLAGLSCDGQLERLRQRYHDTYVDVLLRGTNSMLDAGNFAAALWFCRRALAADGAREDVYQALMMAQAMSGQRTAAMKTFFLCRERLDSALGIPLSRKTIAIYERLLNDDF